MNSFFILILIIYQGLSFTLANEDRKQILEAIKLAYKQYREQKKQSTKIVEDKDAHTFYMNMPCMHCPTLNKTAKQINDIVEKLNEKDPSPEVTLEVEKLEALYYLTELEGTNIECEKTTLFPLNKLDVDLGGV